MAGEHSGRGRTPDPSLVEVIKNASLVTGVLSGIPYAGDDPNPRPIPRVTLADLRDRWTSIGYTHIVKDALFFPIYSDKYSVALDRAVTVPADHLWWMSHSGDTALLSDDVTHHYTSIDKIDRTNNKIHFRDAWTDNFFLLKGNNTFGIEAQIEADHSVSINRDAFLRCVVGLLILDTPSLVRNYFSEFPEQSGNRDILAQFGFALMASHKDSTAAVAASLFFRATQMAASNKDRDIALTLASQSYLAAICGRFWGLITEEGETQKALELIISEVSADYGLEHVENTLGSRDLCRLARIAGTAGDFPGAIHLLNLAVNKDQDCEDAYLLRAEARANQGDARGSVEDANLALYFVNEKTVQLNSTRALLDPRAHWELAWNDFLLNTRVDQRKSGLAVLARAYCQLRSFNYARCAARLLLALEPTNVSHRNRLEEIEQLAIASGYLPDPFSFCGL